MFTILPRIRKKRKMRQMKIPMVSGFNFSSLQKKKHSSACRAAEEYYKNDYPDEIDSSESSNGKRPNPRYIIFTSRPLFKTNSMKILSTNCSRKGLLIFLFISNIQVCTENVTSIESKIVTRSISLKYLYTGLHWFGCC